MLNRKSSNNMSFIFRMLYFFVVFTVWGIFTWSEFFSSYIFSYTFEVSLVLPRSESFKELSSIGFIELETGVNWEVKDMMFSKVHNKQTVKTALAYLKDHESEYFNSRIDGAVIQTQRLEVIIIRHSEYSKQKLKFAKFKKKASRLLSSVRRLFKSPIFFDEGILVFDEEELEKEIGKSKTKRDLFERIQKQREYEILAEPNGYSMFFDFTPWRSFLFEWSNYISFIVAIVVSLFPVIPFRSVMVKILELEKNKKKD